MYYAVPSGLVFGGFMYYMGKFGILDFLDDHKILKRKDNKQNTQKQKVAVGAQVTPIVDNHTFTNQAITPIIRSFQINPKCKIIYSTLHKAPLSVHQFLDLHTIEGQAQRAKYFHTDTNIQPDKFAAKNENYIKPGAYRNFRLTRGHMAAASNFSCNKQLKNSTFSYANTVPQNDYNNGGIWNTFQRYSRSLLKNKKCDTIQIISGPIFNSQKVLQGFHDAYKNQQLVLMKNGVVVPPRLYKIIKCNIQDKTYASGFTFYNEKTYDNAKNLSQFEQSIQEIQDQTGLVFTFKDKLTGKLSEYDQLGLNRSKLRYDKQFYGKLFEYSKSVDEMNDVLRRAYEQKISLSEQRQKNIPKIQAQGEKQLLELKQNTTIGQCKKLSDYYKIHKALFYLGADNGNFKSLQQRLQNQIKNTIVLCRRVANLQQQSMIARKGTYNDKRYTYPHSGLVLQLFPPVRDGAYDPYLYRTSSDTSTSSVASEIPEEGKNR